MPGGRPATKEAPVFGQRLAHYRTQRGLSQSQFAERLGIKRELVGYYERRCANPTMDFVQKAGEVLEVSADDLLGSKPIKAKPGPNPKLQQKFEQVKALPPAKQKLVLDFLETVLQAERVS
jgi:transcriptional regulator with XRE-family HTH domain